MSSWFKLRLKLKQSKSVVSQNGKCVSSAHRKIPSRLSRDISTTRKQRVCGKAHYLHPLPHTPIPHRPLHVRSKGLCQRFLCAQSENPGSCTKGMPPVTGPAHTTGIASAGAPFHSCVPSALPRPPPLCDPEAACPSPPLLPISVSGLGPRARGEDARLPANPSRWLWQCIPVFYEREEVQTGWHAVRTLY